ncbi:MAG: HAMP domain-containing protein [Leptospiraceae bacterium]|nr:HAMP domain-containing protein [Leptospiraceae bacterium]
MSGVVFQRKSSLKAKLVLISSAIVLATAVVITVNSLWVFTTRTEQLIQGLAQNNAKSIAARLEAQLGSYLTFLRLLDSLPRAGAESALKQNPDIVFAGAYRRGEEGLVASYALSQEKLLRELKLRRPQIEKALASYHSEFLRSFSEQVYARNLAPELKKPLIALAIPVIEDNVATHIILAAIRIDSLDAAFAEEDITTSWLMNGDGQVLAHREPQKTLEAVSLQNSVYTKTIEDMKTASGFRRLRFTDNDGTEHDEFYAFRVLSQFNATLASVIPAEVALETVRIIRYRSLLIAGMVLLVAVLVVFLFAKTISDPVKELAGAAAAVQQGDFSVRVKPKSSDEIGELSVAFNSMAQGLAEREQLKGALSKFVNPEIAERALKGDITLGGERLNAAVFFSDIRGFTAISETMEPEQVVEFLNEYMTLMVRIINETDGIVDKFIGDAIMAVWGVPRSKGNDAKNAVTACLRMREALQEFNKNRGGPGKPIIQIGCGLNYGPVLAGQIGSEDRLEYTVIGDTVNLASRIESLNKPLGTDILISSELYNIVGGEFDCVPMQKIKVKGKKEPQQVYAVLRAKGDPKGPATLDELRQRVGIVFDASKKVDVNQEEKKYELL